METKICSKCKIEKTIDCFRKEKRTKNGLQAQCKMCEKEYRLKNREKQINYMKEYYKKNKEELFRLIQVDYRTVQKQKKNSCC